MSETGSGAGLAEGPLSIPLAFEPSGDARAGVQFVARAGRMMVSLTCEGIELDAAGEVERYCGSQGPARNRAAESRGVGESNHFIGNDPKKWRVHVPHFEHAEADILGAKIVVYGNGEGIVGLLFAVAGTYTITVTGTAASGASQSIALTLIVQ